MHRSISIKICFFLCFCISVINAQSKQEKLEAKRVQTLKELKQINALLLTKSTKQKSEFTYIENLSYKVSVRQNLIRITNEQANDLTRQINTNQNEITLLRNQLEELKQDYAAMLLKSYKSKSEQSKVMFLLSSENLAQAYKRYQYMQQYASYQKKHGESIKEKTKELQALNIKLNKQKSVKQNLIEENRLAKKALEKELEQRETLMASLKADMGRYKTQIKQKQTQINQLDKEIERLINAAIAKSNTKAGKKSKAKRFVLTPESKKLAKNFQSNKGKLGWPVSRGVIKGKFGKRRSLVDKSITQNYKSIYIATEKNAEVKSVFNGVVSEIVIFKYGNPAILVRHGNYLTIYTNLSEVYVKKGDKLKTNQVIGKVFTSKTTGESLLGFRINKNSTVLNPELWLARN